MTIVQNRYEFVILFDVRDGNPNGDPDGNNRPRTDQTEHGLVTDVCLKRKVRNYVETFHAGKGNAIYVKQGSVLNVAHDAALKKAGASADQMVSEDDAVTDNDEEPKARGKKGQAKKSKLSAEVVASARADMCREYFDIRAFGAVLANKAANDAVVGPVQIAFARSIDQIMPQEHTITRCAATNEDETKENKTMGRKWTMPYGLYRAHGFISAPLAEKTGFSEDDLKLLFKALSEMFEHDRSSARGLMTTQKLITFKHSNKLGNERADTLFKAIKVVRKDQTTDAQSFEDYDVKVDWSAVPDGVEVNGCGPRTGS